VWAGPLPRVPGKSYRTACAAQPPEAACAGAPASGSLTAVKAGRRGPACFPAVPARRLLARGALHASSLGTAGGKWVLEEVVVSDELFAKMAQSIIDGEAEDAAALAQEGLDAGIAPGDILDQGFVKGIEEVGDLFARGEFFLPELVQGAEAMKAAVAVLDPALQAAGGAGRHSLGSAVAGTVAGDIHEIGKTIVCSMLSAAGFSVTDVGCDVPVETFISKVKETHADLLLLSALLTTTMPNQAKTIEALKEAGLRESVKVMIGGAPTTRAWADEIGADGYAEDAIEAVAAAKALLGV
jgi:corrinoid protein of di/trimethylamine methyltransferase